MHMKLNRLSTSLVIILLLFSANLKSQDDTSGEYIYKHMLNSIEEITQPNGWKSFIVTDPPEQGARNIAEFEPMTGVMVRYPFGVPIQLIKSLAEKDTVFTLVANATEENAVRNQYTSAGIDLNVCKFIHIYTDSYWTRDYSPFFIVDGNNEVGIVNFPYNRPRPNDDDVPMNLATYINMDWYGMNVVHTGGNYMTDGYGASASTDIVYSESNDVGISNFSVNERMLNYLGISKYHVLDDPNNTYIDHIDCWGKFLDVDKILIRSVPKSHAQYDEIEAMAAYWMMQKSSWGNYYKVYRVYTPNDQPYSNSLILNGRVFVPQMNSSWDDEALEVYRDAMPGYEVIGFTGSWLSTDALHCRTHEIADKHMLQILHYPIIGYQEFSELFTIDVDIKDLSNKGLYADSLKIFYKINEGEWENVMLNHQVESSFTGQIKDLTEGAKVEYYVHAADSSGRSENHPYIGSADPHVFYVGGDVPELTLSHDEIIFDTADQVILTVENNYQIPITIMKMDLDLNNAFAETDNSLVFPIELDQDETMSFRINPKIAIKKDTEYKSDTIKISTLDSLYKVVIKTDESFLQGLQTLSNINILSYPNPFNDILKISVTDLEGCKYFSAQVTDVSGKIVEYLKPTVENNNVLEFEWNTANKEITDGIYFVSIIFNEGIKTFKVIKK